jgi:hypothetical protein
MSGIEIATTRQKKIADSQRLRQSDQVRGPVAQDAHAMTLPFGVAPRDQRTGILQRMAQVPGEQ